MEEIANEASLATRRPRRQNRQLPKRFRDILPQAQPSLPPPDLPPSPTASNGESQAALSHTLASATRKILRTPRNLFGLVRQYYADKFPSVDPEEEVGLVQLSDCPIASVEDEASTTIDFFPFPNESSFRLGHWYWTGGVQKSLQSFKDLIDIVGHTDFDPDDVRETKWDKINRILGDNVEKGQEGEWMDVDAGWKTTPIKIEVPFHKRMQTPGVKEYITGNLHHRSLVDVIKERIADPHSASTFHMEPYKLLWQPSKDRPEIRLHGELYTSDAFLEEHQALQDSPREPGCDLPRVVVGCMLYSDQTHLTAFGDNHLWPGYLHFGNDTKYCRCKPSCNLCSHVAYFEAVGLSVAYSHYWMLTFHLIIVTS